MNLDATLVLTPMLFQKSLHRYESIPMKLDPLIGVTNTGVLNQSPKHHEETDKQINIHGLHVGYLGQGGVDGVDEGGHGEDSGDPQPYPGWSCSSVEPEGDPGHHHDQTAGDVNLNMTTQTSFNDFFLCHNKCSSKVGNLINIFLKYYGFRPVLNRVNRKHNAISGKMSNIAIKRKFPI